KDWLGWEEVQSQLKSQEIDPIRREMLSAQLESARRKIPEGIQQAYCVVVTVSEDNDVQAFRLQVAGGDSLFATIKADPRSRIQDAPVSADSLLPGGPYALWKDSEKSRRVKDLVGAFAQFPHLPKMLRQKEILDTLVLGERNGLFVLRATRPDRSIRTFWRSEPEVADLRDPGLEVVLPEEAELTRLLPGLLAPNVLPGLWKEATISVQDVRSYFAGGVVTKVQHEGYAEQLTVPKAPPAIVDEAIRRAVVEGTLWLTSGPASVWKEEIPTGILTSSATLQAPPSPIGPLEIVPPALAQAWERGSTTALAIAAALGAKAGRTLPWVIVQECIDGAQRARYVERTIDSGPWPCEYHAAGAVRLKLPEERPASPAPLPDGILTAEATLRLNQIQDLAEQVPEIVKAAVGYDTKFRVQLELGTIGGSVPTDVIVKVNKILKEIDAGLEFR
ncbi:MAG: hypothetical protein L3K17_07295, partial [Thermoplasmata archaeon]|nr:hypothetical protein [Thermoplasmata archaeon]